MENNNRYSKYIALIALLISIVGVSLGFAAFSNTVQIKAQADVRPGGGTTPIAELSKDPSTQTDGDVTPTTTGGCTAEDADLTDDSIENIVVHFTAPGQSATYSFYAVNPSTFVSYLNEIEFATPEKTCTAYNGNGNPGTASYIADACDVIHITVTAGSGASAFEASDLGGTETGINGHSVAANGYEPVTVVVEYLDGDTYVDGDFDVAFGDITLKYSTVD